jgi:hypothetical protein
MKGDVATPETWIPSRRMRAAAAAERERVERELRRLDSRREELQEDLGAATAAAAELRDQLRVLNRFVHDGDADVLSENGTRPPLRVIEARR